MLLCSPPPTIASTPPGPITRKRWTPSVHADIVAAIGDRDRRDREGSNSDASRRVQFQFGFAHFMATA
jgi:hypothetical protein